MRETGLLVLVTTCKRGGMASPGTIGATALTCVGRGERVGVEFTLAENIVGEGLALASGEAVGKGKGVSVMVGTNPSVGSSLGRPMVGKYVVRDGVAVGEGTQATMLSAKALRRMVVRRIDVCSV